MPRSRFRLSILGMMYLVVQTAVVLWVSTTAGPVVDQYLRWEYARILPWHWWLVSRIIATTMVGAPFVTALHAAVSAWRFQHDRRKRLVHASVATGLMLLGLGLLRAPVNGLAVAWALRDGSQVHFLHRYRFWPGDQITPVLRAIELGGDPRYYVIARNQRLRGDALLRTSLDQRLLWLASMRGTVRAGAPMVWCSLDRDSGRFVSFGEPQPPTVLGRAGFPPTPPIGMPLIDLRLLPPSDSLDSFPKGTPFVVAVGRIQGRYHIRLLNATGAILFDVDEASVGKRVPEMAALRDYLDALPAPPSLTPEQETVVLTGVAAIVEDRKPVSTTTGPGVVP